MSKEHNRPSTAHKYYSKYRFMDLHVVYFCCASKIKINEMHTNAVQNSSLSLHCIIIVPLIFCARNIYTQLLLQCFSIQPNNKITITSFFDLHPHHSRYVRFDYGNQRNMTYKISHQSLCAQSRNIMYSLRLKILNHAKQYYLIKKNYDIDYD